MEPQIMPKGICSAHGTTPCLREVDGEIVCVFDQTKPENGVLVGPPGVLVEPRDRHAWHLVYRRPDGSEVVVPNGGDNQPVAWRIEAMRWEAERCRRRAEFHRTQPGTTSKFMVVEMMTQADDLEARARGLEASP